MSHLFLLGLFAALLTQPSSLLDFSFNNGSMAWNFKERRLERQLLREERRLERQLKRQQLNSNSFSTSSATDSFQSISHNGTRRTYILHKPNSPSDVKLPLVIALHGGKSSGRRLVETSRLNEISDQENFLVVYPDAKYGNWSDGRSVISHGTNDVDFINTLITSLASNHSVDTSRVYVIGISNGSFMAQRLACELPHKISAISVIAGALPIELESVCQPDRPMPVIMFSGTKDNTVPWSGGTMSRGEGGKVLSPFDTAKWWASNNKCSHRDKIPVTSNKNIQPDKTSIEQYTFSGCDDLSTVVFYKIIGGGHTWPGGGKQPRWLLGPTSTKINASMLSWKFFSQYTL